MKRFIASLLTVGVGVIYCVLGSAAMPIALAATSSSTKGGGQALEIAPPIITLNANPGQTVKTQIKLRDVSPTNLVVTNQINDFVANGEDGTPKILTQGSGNDPYSMKDWISPVQQLTMVPQQIKNLNVTINVPSDASPGGHYAVIRFTGTPTTLHTTGVSLSASLGALVLLTVSGKINHSMSIVQFAASKDGKVGTSFSSAPIDFIIRLKNNGNVQEQPTGHILVTDMFGKSVASLIFNIPPHNVLPSSIRKFTATLGSTTIGSRRLFGLYHAKMTVSYNGNQTLTGNISFWVIPWGLIITIIVILIAAFFGVRYGIKRYNEYIIRQSHRPTRKHK